MFSYLWFEGKYLLDSIFLLPHHSAVYHNKLHGDRFVVFEIPDLKQSSLQVLEHVLSVKDTASMASLLEVVVILWRSIRKALELNKDALQYTTAKFGSVVPKYFNVFQV